MMQHNYNNALFKHPAVLDNLVFGVPFATDAQMREFLYKRYMMYDLAYPDENTMAIVLQARADAIKDYYIALYDTSTWEYDPLANVDAEETRTITVNGTLTNESDVYQYPASTTSRQTGKQVDTQRPNTTTTDTFIRKGNIGVTASQTLVQMSRDLLLNFIDKYTHEFNHCFMLTM